MPTRTLPTAAPADRPGRGTRLVRRALDLALVVLAGVVLASAVLGRILPFLGRDTYMISSGSMVPAIPVGAAVIVDPGARDIRVGDVISVRLTGAHVYTHRVTRVVDRNGGTWFETKGDANAEPDPAIVPATSVVGRVDASIPFAGYLLRLLSMPAGIIFLVGLGATLWVASWLLESSPETDRSARGHAIGAVVDVGNLEAEAVVGPARAAEAE